MPRIPNTEKREALLKEREQLDQKLRALDKAAAEQARKDDTRRKIVAGAIALEHLNTHPDDPAAAKLKALLNDFVAERDRALFPFLSGVGPALPARPRKKPKTNGYDATASHASP